MNSSQDLFNTLAGFKNSNSGTPQQLLVDYCKNFLGPVERLHFDFKTKHDTRDARLSDSDKKNLAKAASGFANSAGGVLIWGIEDETLDPKPIKEIQAFTAALLNLTTNITDPVVRNVDAVWLPSDAADGSGFALMYIPESDLPPHRVILKDPEVKDRYYIRSADSFVPSTHTQLEDMFGRRPRPVLSLSTRCEFHSATGIPVHSYMVTVVLGIRNEGRGSARAPFLWVRVDEPYVINLDGLDGNKSYGLRRLPSSPRTSGHQYGASADTIIHPGVTHDVTSVEVGFKAAEIRIPPNLVVNWQIAAEGIQPINGVTTLTNIDFSEAISRWHSNNNSG